MAGMAMSGSGDASESGRQPGADQPGAQPPVEAWSAAQTWAFDRIYDEFKTPIHNYIFHLVGNREQAEDLTQDTFLKAFKALPRMDV